MESYVDFFYITNNCMKDFLQNSNFGFSINSRLDNFYDASEDNLNSLSSRLIKAEEVNFNKFIIILVIFNIVKYF